MWEGVGCCCSLIGYPASFFSCNGDKGNGDCEKIRNDGEVYLGSLVESPIGSLCRRKEEIEQREEGEYRGSLRGLFGSFCQRVFPENMEVKRMVKVKVRRGSVTGFFLLLSLREETGVEFIPTTGHGV